MTNDMFKMHVSQISTGGFVNDIATDYFDIISRRNGMEVKK